MQQLQRCLLPQQQVGTRHPPPLLQWFCANTTFIFMTNFSRANGQRNIRCFPTCSPVHNDKNFCGRPVKALVHLYVDKERVNEVTFDSICCVGEYKPQESTYSISGTLTGDALQAIVRPKPSNQRSTYWGRLAETLPTEFSGSKAHLRGIFEFNTELRGWSYAWHGTRFRGSARHVFSITVVLLNRTATTKALKPLWPFNLGMDFRGDLFEPLAFFDSPPFTFGSFKERPEAASSSSSVPMTPDGTVLWSHRLVPEDYDPSAEPALLGLPSACFEGIDICCQDDVFNAVHFGEQLSGGVDQLEVTPEDVLLRTAHGLPELSVLSSLLSSAPDLQALHRHKRRVESCFMSEAARRDYLSIHDYFQRLRLLQQTFNPDPVQRHLQDLLPGGPPKSIVPFPYRPAGALSEFITELLDKDKAIAVPQQQQHIQKQQRRLLADLLDLSLIFPVSLEPAIYFLLTLRTPIEVDQHCFSRVSTMQPQQPPPPAAISRASSSLSFLTDGDQLPSVGLGASNGGAGGSVGFGMGIGMGAGQQGFEPLISLSMLTSEPSAPVPVQAPASPASSTASTVEDEPLLRSVQSMPLQMPLHMPTEQSVLAQQTMETFKDEPAGPWLILRMVAEYYSGDGQNPSQPRQQVGRTAGSKRKAPG